jgi:hypothetical protein
VDDIVNSLELVTLNNVGEINGGDEVVEVEDEEFEQIVDAPSLSNVKRKRETLSATHLKKRCVVFLKEQELSKLREHVEVLAKQIEWCDEWITIEDNRVFEVGTNKDGTPCKICRNKRGLCKHHAKKVDV